jgi:uncharacterized protein
MNTKERFIISNQLKILEALYPDEAQYYSQHRTAFEEGYESHYDWAMEHISSVTLKEDVTREIIDTLDMYRAIYFYQRDHGIDGLNEYALKFSGYDGNDSFESKMMGYARYFVVELKRFKEVLEKQGEHFDFNSHAIMREKYQRMLAIWKGIPAGMKEGERHKLTIAQLKSILEA